MSYSEALLKSYPDELIKYGTNFKRFNSVNADEYENIDDILDILERNIFPDTSIECLSEWEDLLGLSEFTGNDTSTRQINATTALVSLPKMNYQTFVDIATKAGYTVKIPSAPYTVSGKEIMILEGITYEQYNRNDYKNYVLVLGVSISQDLFLVEMFKRRICCGVKLYFIDKEIPHYLQIEQVKTDDNPEIYINYVKPGFSGGTGTQYVMDVGQNDTDFLITDLTPGSWYVVSSNGYSNNFVVEHGKSTIYIDSISGIVTWSLGSGTSQEINIYEIKES